MKYVCPYFTDTLLFCKIRISMQLNLKLTMCTLPPTGCNSDLAVIESSHGDCHRWVSIVSRNELENWFILKIITLIFVSHKKMEETFSVHECLERYLNIYIACAKWRWQQCELNTRFTCVYSSCTAMYSRVLQTYISRQIYVHISRKFSEKRVNGKSRKI